MTRHRRDVLKLGGGLLAALSLPAILRGAPSDAVAVVEMAGTARGEHVWFRPHGLHVNPGTLVRFVNRDAGNSHTATAYHPDLYGRSLRIPDAATPWDSGFLLPDAQFEVMLTVPGVYDYYCLPHEMAGMVGRIVVGRPTDAGWQGPVESASDLPDAALNGFAPVDDILAQGAIQQGGEP
ncbi:plastocyanin/azurin family copper-binding protein [Thalassorhabdomicrobium marinisediminis]|uniref:Blue (type 1) copper domain-containing protein n=1 Tax=Thalassorhabdomicrobium marinisediminis TaxID=2170577 RepID=A0A2T7G1M5_9RHOB|nr:plastocyanin/azurin family copper-binding protein [Thalassorhabdomicrobium marinisediminis]PVA08325.1 hypothetical protein DC363_02225 [Thalassorhabdomicrobium marinisediminis]